jgi:hypothetical protein
MRGEERMATIIDEIIKRHDIPAKKIIKKPDQAIIIEVPKSG